MALVNLIGLALIATLIRIPNIYIFSLDSPFFLTNNIARFLCISIIVVNVFKKNACKTQLFTVLFILLYFISQSLPILSTHNYQGYLTTYKDVVFGMLFYYLGYLIMNKKERLSVPFILLLAVCINLSIELSLYFDSPLRNLMKLFMNDNYSSFFNYQADRNRFFGDSLDEAFIPVLLYILFLSPREKLMTKIISGIAFGVILFLTIVGSWRTKLLIMYFSLFSSLIVVIYQKGKQFVFPIIAIMVVVYMSSTTFFTLGTPHNIFVRLSLSEEDDIEKEAIVSRKEFVYEAIEQGMSSPLLGVGLGNFYDNLSALSKDSKKIKKVDMRKKFILIDDPHNLFISTFASSGLIGLSALCALLINFIYRDVRHMVNAQRDPLTVMLVITFWSIFIFAVFNPWLYFAYLATFWFMRGILDKFQHISIKK